MDFENCFVLQRSKFGGKQSIFHDDTVYVGHIGSSR